MQELVEGKEPNDQEPLRNAEFFAALARVPADDRSRIMAALWQVANGCRFCGGTAKKELYGVEIDADAAAYSGCGWYMHGAHLNCRDDDALAVWDRKNGAFYFAVTPHSDDGLHNEGGKAGAVVADRYYPPLEGWSLTALKRLDNWRRGSKWSDQND